MIPIVFINCSDVPYVDKILSGEKLYETRSRNTLGQLVGKRVMIAETGHGKPVVRCTARIGTSHKITNPNVYDLFRPDTCVPEGSKHDWTHDTKSKWFYLLKNVSPVTPFIPKEGPRHGRIWMEYCGRG